MNIADYDPLGYELSCRDSCSQVFLNFLIICSQRTVENDEVILSKDQNDMQLEENNENIIIESDLAEQSHSFTPENERDLEGNRNKVTRGRCHPPVFLKRNVETESSMPIL